MQYVDLPCRARIKGFNLNCKTFLDIVNCFVGEDFPCGGFFFRLCLVGLIIGRMENLREKSGEKMDTEGVCKIVIYNYVFCWFLFRTKFDCNFIQSFVPCIYCGF